MSKYFNEIYKNLIPYTPGEQPKAMDSFVKLNTNESPFPPSELVLKSVSEESKKLRLYSDPECTEFRKVCAEYFNVSPDMIFVGNGSDEVLYLSFMAFGASKNGVIFPDITYGFYPVYCEINHLNYSRIPLNDDFTINIDDYVNSSATVFIANPNAPTGIALSFPIR